MIIAHGKLYENSVQDEILSNLEQDIEKTLASSSLDTERVISAIDVLSVRAANGEYDADIAALDIEGAEAYKELAVKLLSRQNIEFKLKTELGEGFKRSYVTEPPYGMTKLYVRHEPLGVLFHIAAGNADGLPAFSLAEGLITGNINILKLPQADNGLSVKIITELIEIEPELADYIYVFDTPSSDVAAMQRMADIADGIVVWGGEAAVAAVRRLANVNTKLIEWGHKLSFAYVSEYENMESELDALAEHIVSTRQLLCSSCQVIYIDSESMDDVYSFCDAFMPRLERAALAHLPSTIDGRAEVTLREYTEMLESFVSGSAHNVKYRSKYCALIPKEDSELELSDLFGRCLVKRLPRDRIISTLRKKKGFLQTAGLICSKEQRGELAYLLIKSGVVRVTSAGDMSAMFSGEAHDGEYPLRRYMRVTNTEITTE